MSKKGVNILHGTMDVYQVEDISKTDLSGNDRLYYYLVPRFEKGTTIYIPVNSDKVKTREITARQQAKRFVTAWPSVRCKKYANDREGPQTYREILQSDDCPELASMIKRITNVEQSHRGSGKMLPIRKRDDVKCVCKLLFGELAATLDIYPEETPDYVQNQTGRNIGTT